MNANKEQEANISMKIDVLVFLRFDFRAFFEKRIDNTIKIKYH